MTRSLVMAGALCLTMASCATGPRPPASTPPVVSVYLSGDAVDWEPSLAVGSDDAVYVIAGRPLPPPPGSNRRFGETQIVTWSSLNGGTTFGPPSIYSMGGGDERIKADRNGTLYASFIRLEWDSSGAAVDMAKGGLVLATSRDRGVSWESRLAAPMASGVADKPELAISDDGRDVYIAFMARGTLDVVASHDGGVSWERHIADSTYTGHWPTSFVLAPDGSLYVTNVRKTGTPRDSILRMELDLLQSRDRGKTWRRRTVSTSTRRNRAGDCVHGATCPVQIPYPVVAVDGRNRVYLAYTEGTVGRAYAIKLVRSDDGGATWTAPSLLSAARHAPSGDDADNFYPMLAAANNGLVYVVWFDDRDGPLNVWAKRSTDAGRTWSNDVRLSARDGIRGIFGEYGGLAIDSRGWLHVAWPEGTGHVSAGGRGGTWYSRWDGR